jgi:hypothetical protein
MPATVTLSSTTLATGTGAADPQIKVSSVSGLTPGIRLFVDGELMSVVSLGLGTSVNVRRGVDGTASAAHPQMATVWIGRADQFYSTDPVGQPAASIPVSPYINAANGSVWFAQGDSGPASLSVRWWQQQNTARTVGPLGIITPSTDVSAST